MKNKDKIVIIRLTEKEDKIVRELRKIYSVNISNLVRTLLNEYYEKNFKKA